MESDIFRCVFIRKRCLKALEKECLVVVSKDDFLLKVREKD